MRNPVAGKRRIAFVAVGASLLALVVSCSSGPTPSAQPVAAQPTSSGPSPNASVYASTSFVIPFDVDPPGWLQPAPTVEQGDFVTWQAPNAPAVRILAPETLYPPGEKEETAVPNDYLPYLLGQTSAGAHFTDQTTTTIGGQTATLLTATTDRSLDGSLGCPAKGTLAAACFGLQPDFALRMAVLHINDRSLLIWLRTEKSMKPEDAATHIKWFDAMLASFRFSARPVQSAEQTSSTPIDGTYQMSISWPRIKTAEARCVGGAEGASAKVVYELLLDRGSLTLFNRVGGLTAPREVGMTENYRVGDTKLTFGDLVADFTFDGRKLTLSNMQGGECGDVAIWTTKPWVRK